MKQLTQPELIPQAKKRLRNPAWMEVFIALLTLGSMLLLMMAMGSGSGR